jgi:hypothetical protein
VQAADELKARQTARLDEPFGQGRADSPKSTPQQHVPTVMLKKKTKYEHLT